MVGVALTTFKGGGCEALCLNGGRGMVPLKEWWMWHCTTLDPLIPNVTFFSIIVGISPSEITLTNTELPFGILRVQIHSFCHV